MHYPLILGSQSPRRREILNFFDLPFQQISSEFDEESIPFSGNPQKYVEILSKGKADALSHRFPQALILTADTIVFKKGQVYGKPKNWKNAFESLRQLSGEWHSVFTGLTISFAGRYDQVVEETRVLFHSLTEEQIHHYYHMLAPFDKAGGYMIQGAGGLIVKRMEGCYYNVMGLPINALSEILNRVGIDLWKHFRKHL